MAKNLRLKAARAAKDMSQKDVAEAVGVARQTINAIENGDYNVDQSLHRHLQGFGQKSGSTFLGGRKCNRIGAA